MIVEIFSCGPLHTNAFLIGCKDTGMAAVVDPAYQSFDPIMAKVEELSLTLEKVLLTHSHWDHIADVYDFKEKFGLPVYIHPLDIPNLEKPGVDGVPMFFPIKGVKPDVLLKEGQIIEVGQLSIEVIHTPGHSPGSVCFYVPKHGILLSGDTLFEGSIGNLSLSTSDPDSMWPSLEKLAKLPPETLVFPGHGNPTKIGKEAWLSKAKKKIWRNNMNLVGNKAPSFKAKAVCKDVIQEDFSLESLKGKYVVFFFYPLDFTFVCPTELHAFQEKLSEFEKRNAQVVGCSIDSHFSHHMWLNTPKNKGGIEGVSYPIVSDLSKSISTSYGVLKDDEGIAYRGLFLIDRDQVIRHQLINDLPLGRSVDEALRILDALIFHEKNGEVCPANWKKGSKSMKPSQEGLKDYFTNV